MIRTAVFLAKVAEPFTVLCLGAHSDDIEIGCGATLLHFKKDFSATEVPLGRLQRARVSEVGRPRRPQSCLHPVARKKIVLKEYRDGFLPYSGHEVKGFFEDLKGKTNPDLIFTHWRGDAHQDHRLLSELTWNTFRDHLILEYEIPKYDGDMGRPNLFVPLEAPLYETKIDYLFEAFESQLSKRWFERETFLGLMRIRGMECNAASGYAEGFYCRKIVL